MKANGGLRMNIGKKGKTNNSRRTLYCGKVKNYFIATKYIRSHVLHSHKSKSVSIFR